MTRRFAAVPLLAAALSAAGPAVAAPSFFTGAFTLNEKTYIALLRFEPGPERPTAEPVEARRNIQEATEFDNGDWGGRQICACGAEFKLGEARLSLFDEKRRLVDQSRSSAAAVLVVRREVVGERFASKPTECALAAGPLPEGAFVAVDGELTVGVPDPDAPGQPFVSLQLGVLGHDAFPRAASGARLSADGTKLALEGFDAAASAADLGLLASGRRVNRLARKYVYGEPRLLPLRPVR